MLPLRNAIRSGPNCRCRSPSLASLRAISSAPRPPLALSSKPASVYASTVPSSLRALHSSSRLGKEKKWVNSTEDKEKDKKEVDGEEEAESSRTAEKRAKGNEESVKSTSGSASASGSGSGSGEDGGEG
ncbi:hypothetical protein P7C73_g6756, partial [Tremellales sp. Uapishka_1]